MMKFLNAPGKVYSRNEIIHVCAFGELYGPKGNKTQFNLDNEVRCELAAEDGSKISVKQKRGGRVLTETWTPVKLKTKKRSAKK